ncbi:hypothetical protein [Planctomyces sp. SH-PL14]|uniref:hypothetical protein n=1 Tax=Planctomyces sp. SH-PL14 TaxID=1632864 RepID=UPI00078E7F50|nr:hypothetical protein [Planctomyces sp. SH-PL14]AMV19581.1 hypothetical protein VT03_16925 [Planctomyces sp. SH-PL14]
MQDLVLLPDEVALLKRSALQGGLCGTHEDLSQEAAFEFFCEQGLAELRANGLRLTSWGNQVARELVEDGNVGVVRLRPSVLAALHRA